MLRIVIYVNEIPIEEMIAVREEYLTTRNRIYIYKVGRKKIKHRYSDGAKKLAIKMLKTKL